MTDISFAPVKLYPSGKFASHCSLQRRDYFGLRWFAAPRAFTSGTPHPEFSEYITFYCLFDAETSS